MDRDIKFKAWHKNNKTMCHNVTTDLLSRDYLVFMQYTGLRDNTKTEEYPNGREIYEGDIISYKSNEETLYKVCFSKGSFKISNIKYPNANLHLLEEINGWCEVVGNIFENLELIDLKS